MIYTVNGKRVMIHEREEWVTSPPFSGPKPNHSLIHHFVIHWPGANDDWKPPTDTAENIRQGHASYVANKGYSYGYGFVIGVNPIQWDNDPVVLDTWEVRGFDIQIASNDGDIGEYGEYANPNFNGRSCSAQLLSSTKYPALPDQIKQAQYLVAIADQIYGETLTVIPHRESDSTFCPGDYLASQIDVIAQRPGSAEPIPPTPPPTTLEEANPMFIARSASGITYFSDGLWKRAFEAENDDDATLLIQMFQRAGNPVRHAESGVAIEVGDEVAVCSDRTIRVMGSGVAD